MDKKTEALKLALSVLDEVRSETFRLLRNGQKLYAEEKVWNAIFVIKQALAEQPAPQQEPVTVLPDGSAFAVMSYPLPKDHWLYADRQYNDGEYEPVELGKPVLTQELRDAVVSAVRYAIRGATNCGKEVDFDPDALVQNAVYALCGPFTSPPASKPLTDEQILSLVPGLQDCLCDPWDYNNSGDYYASIPKDMIRLARAIEAAHGIKE